ncbi:MAG: hypothetical protein BJ554DRAFT_2336 [Olpidium bornovanus]|uniref:Uncharacterized protein n=1 Tax=Olpidium bornovanus TaxID=278681 RepID=A0A8H7ZQK6_9FUNG|nr:MAG: hypothetical protein BJ554DRAFT_2336 [Olpidium bornovanus]
MRKTAPPDAQAPEHSSSRRLCADAANRTTRHGLRTNSAERRETAGRWAGGVTQQTTRPLASPILEFGRKYFEYREIHNKQHGHRPRHSSNPAGIFLILFGRRYYKSRVGGGCTTESTASPIPESGRSTFNIACGTLVWYDMYTANVGRMKKKNGR